MKSKYVPQKIAAEYFSVSERTLLTMRQTGMLIEGSCWRRKIPQNPNSHVLYNLDACEEVLIGLQRARSMEQDLLVKDKEVASACKSPLIAGLI